MFASWLRRLADYLDPPTVPAPPSSLFLDRVRSLIAIWDAQLGVGFGEAKRHQVYAQLLKEFPGARKRDLAFAIEQVLHEVP